ncbi:MAG: UTP--glucose-1-phosphate uridylyltransferase GalU [Magnetococcales bacterium]|nr:UTP--glucose-1-phosphate uridylyltransferase GalU [Magnetococcales bacterium]
MKVRKAVLPVAGLGTRFLPATKSIPKEMLPVVDRPIIDYAVSEAWDAGIEQVILVTGRGKGALEDYFDHAVELETTLSAKGNLASLRCLLDGLPKDGTISYVRQQQPLGLGHAVWCARHLVGNEPFAVLLPDDLIAPPLDGAYAGVPTLRQMVQQFERLGVAVVAAMEVAAADVSKYGIIDPRHEVDDLVAINGLIEKPAPEQAPSSLAVIGRYILPPEIFTLLERGQRGAGGEIQLTDALVQLLAQQPMYGYRFHGTRFDCGTKVGFQMANLEMALRHETLRAQLLPFFRTQIAKWQHL